MKKTIRLFTLGLLCSLLVGCANTSRIRSLAEDDRKVAMTYQIEVGVTTEATLLEWFGQPGSRSFDSHVGEKLTWAFAPPGSRVKLVVTIAKDGKVNLIRREFASTS